MDPAVALLYAAFWVVGIAVRVLIILVVCQKAWEAEAPTALPATETATALPPPPPPSPRDRCRYYTPYWQKGSGACPNCGSY